MDLVMQIVGYLSIPIVLVAVFSMMVGLRRERELTTRELVIGVVAPVAILVAYRLVLSVETNQWWWALFGAGMLVGGLAASTVRLRTRDSRVYATRNYWFLGLWGLTFTFAQLTVLGVLPFDLGAGLGAMYLGTGVAVGVNGVLWFRRRAALSGGAAETLEFGPSACPHCGFENKTTAGTCRQCGWRVLPRAAPAPQSHSVAAAGSGR